MFPNLIDNREFGQKILNMRWWIKDITGADHDLLTSDRPLFLYNFINKPEQSCIVFPITPHKAFIAAENYDHIYQSIQKAGKNKFIERLNETVVTQAKKYVYGASNGHGNFIKKRLGANHSQLPYAS
jgi:hypothetical protein